MRAPRTMRSRRPFTRITFPSTVAPLTFGSRSSGASGPHAAIPPSSNASTNGTMYALITGGSGNTNTTDYEIVP